jgi:proteasome accessory factor C
MTTVPGRAGYRARTAVTVQHAAERRRALRITYASAWQPRVTERTIHPYRVVSTSRGYEVDAGPLDAQGRPRTFLLTGIRELRILDEGFARPAGLAAVLERNRDLTPVRGVAPHRRMWAIRHWSERVEQRTADGDDVAFTAWLLPPVADRVALMCLVAGPQVDLDDDDLVTATRSRARELLAHHGL